MSKNIQGISIHESHKLDIEMSIYHRIDNLWYILITMGHNHENEPTIATWMKPTKRALSKRKPDTNDAYSTTPRSWSSKEAKFNMALGVRTLATLWS